MHVPPEHAWPPAHAPQLPPQPSSPQSAPWQLGLQLFAAHTAHSPPGVWPQRIVGSSQVSAVHASPSSHGTGPATHLPFTYRSSPLQKTPSLQVTSVAAATDGPNAPSPP